MFWCFAGVGADLHVHRVDDVEEILHHSYALQGGVGPRHAVHTLGTQGENMLNSQIFTR